MKIELFCIYVISGCSETFLNMLKTFHRAILSSLILLCFTANYLENIGSTSNQPKCPKVVVGGKVTRFISSYTCPAMNRPFPSLLMPLFQNRNLCAKRFISRKLISRSNELICISNDLICRSNELICRSNDLIFRSNELICRSNELNCMKMNLLCEQTRFDTE